MVKKTFYILTLCALLLQGGGYVFYKSIQQSIWKYSSQKVVDLKSKNAKNFSFSLDDYKKIKIDEKEFLYDESLFDIIKFDISVDSIYITAYEDTYDLELFKEIRNLTNTDDSKDDFPSYVKLLSNLVFIIPEMTSFNFLNTKFNKFHKFHYLFSYHNSYNLVSIKPPAY